MALKREIASLFELERYADLARLAASLSACQLEELPSATLKQAALACAVLEQAATAEKLFNIALRRNADDQEAATNLGVLLLRERRYAESAALLLPCLHRSPEDLNLLFNVGLVNFATGDYRSADRCLSRYLKRELADPVVRLYLARCRTELGDRQVANRLAHGLVAENFSGLRECYELARLRAGQGLSEEAERIYRLILLRDPRETAARINLASLLERANRGADAIAELDHAGSAAHSSPHAWLVRAHVALSNDDAQSALKLFDEAAACLNESLNSEEYDSLLAEVMFGRGKARDRLGEYSRAYMEFEQANRTARDRYRNLMGDVDAQSQPSWLEDSPSLDSHITYLQTELIDEATPIFLVGFPRSGTTLLDQVLDSHSSLQVMEERPALEELAFELENIFGSTEAGIRSIEREGRSQMRALYYQKVEEYLERDPHRHLVDKYPLGIVRLQLGMTIFPRSRWIFMIRHPCDVVLSCFMQNFRFTNATQGFWTIQETADIYIRAMTLWLNQRERLCPRCLDIRYEDMVTNLEIEARRLFDFLELSWDDRVLEYYKHALERRISTPSYRQVVKPIYNFAKRRWLNYKDQLAPILPKLQPIIERLGYTAE